MTKRILTLHCKDRSGIVAAVATCLSNADCNIEEASQFNDPLSGQFFMRVVIKPLNEAALDLFSKNFELIATEFEITWKMNNPELPVKTLILVSKTDHCLNDILYRWRTKHLNIDIVAIASNHNDNRSLAEERGIAYHHYPITKETKAEQEDQIRNLISATGAELIVMARYMQILSSEFCQDFTGQVINIHHSFLPGFKGARPYHQAYERGVKIIGATAHFATLDLDEGPIIEQNIVRIDHSYPPEKLQILGRDTESRVLAKAIDLYCDRRIFLQGNRTVIL
ncbi:MAG: formyltetrahydrofolate deformylase [Micavibrio sp.]|nr:formyltetrahydrofolate deformylase [Micavibrio sp.]|tara:strand:+ start:1193 stop:2038 length:846 start_codon:yes stop_codon:yes gene_type:complete